MGWTWNQGGFERNPESPPPPPWRKPDPAAVDERLRGYGVDPAAVRAAAGTIHGAPFTDRLPPQDIPPRRKAWVLHMPYSEVPMRVYLDRARALDDIALATALPNERGAWELTETEVYG